MPGSKEINADLELKGKLNVYTVPNAVGTGILTYNNATKDISQRTGTELISDLGLITASNIAAAYYTKTQSDAKYIPYTGATTNIDLNAKNITNVNTLVVGAIPTGAGLEFKYDGTNGGAIQTYGAKNLFINPLGNNVGIGYTTAASLAAKLDVNGSIRGTSFVKTGGTAVQFLKADGSVDTNTYSTVSASDTKYVPYTGATTNIDIGARSLSTSGVIRSGYRSAVSLGTFGITGTGIMDIKLPNFNIMGTLFIDVYTYGVLTGTFVCQFYTYHGSSKLFAGSNSVAFLGKNSNNLAVRYISIGADNSAERHIYIGVPSTSWGSWTTVNIRGIGHTGFENLIANPPTVSLLAAEPTTDFNLSHTFTDFSIESALKLQRSVIAGNGLTGGGLLTTDQTLTLGTPSTLGVGATNSVTSTSHSHAITTTTSGAANTIVQTDASGIITASGGNSTNWNTAFTNNHTHSNKATLDLINQNLGTTHTPVFNGVTVGYGTTNKGFSSATPFAFLNTTAAQQIYTGGILASSAYADSSKLPTNGIYSKGMISAGDSIEIQNELSSAAPFTISRTSAQVGMAFKVGANVNYLGVDIAGVLKYGTNLNHSTNNTVWHSGNDGATSGLDADLLDGQHGSYYATVSSLNNYLPLAGGTMIGDNVGISFYGGSKIYKKPGVDFVLQMGSNGVNPKIENTAGTELWDIWHAGNLPQSSIDTWNDAVTKLGAQNITGLKNFQNGFDINTHKFRAIDATNVIVAGGKNAFNNNLANISDSAIGIGNNVFPAMNLQPYDPVTEPWNNKGYIGIGSDIFSQYTGATNYRPTHNAHDSWIGIGRLLGKGFLDGTNVTMMGTTNLHWNDVPYADLVTVIGKGFSNGIRTRSDKTLDPNRVVTAKNGVNVHGMMSDVIGIGHENWIEDISQSVVIGSNLRPYSYVFNSLILGHNHVNMNYEATTAQADMYLDSDVIIGMGVQKRTSRHAESHNLLIGMDGFYTMGSEPNPDYRPLVEGKFKDAEFQVNGIITAGHEAADTDKPNETNVPLVVGTLPSGVTFNSTTNIFTFDGSQASTEFKIGDFIANPNASLYVEINAPTHTAGSWGSTVNGVPDSGNTAAINFTKKASFIVSTNSDFKLSSADNFQGTLKVIYTSTDLLGEGTLPNIQLKDSNENITTEIRGGKLENGHLGIGSNSGKFLHLGINTVAIGTNAYSKGVISSNSVLLGANAGKNNSYALNDVIIGYSAGENMTLGSGSNTLVGAQTLKDPLERITSTSTLGKDSLLRLQYGKENTAIGAGAGFTLLNGSNNFFGGYNSGLIKNGSGNVFLGSLAGGYALMEATVNNTIVIGSGVSAEVPNNTTTIGGPSNTDNFFQGITHSHAFKVRGGTATQVMMANGTVKEESAVVGSHTHTFASLTSKPTTLSGYGITDAAPKTIGYATTNSVAADGHTHAITSTFAGAASTLVSTTSTGGVNAQTFGVLNTSASSGGGIGLYSGVTGGGGALPDYGLAFAGIGTFGTHGSVTGDWATYFTMSGAGTRGWIFKLGNSGTGGNVASISATGVITALGGNSTNWNTAFTNNHTHANKANLDTINQNLGTTHSPTFSTAFTSRLGRFGTYSSAETQNIWSMGASYTVAASTTTLGNLYGLGYSYISVGGTSVAAKHQIHFAENGVAKVTMNTTDGEVRASRFTSIVATGTAPLTVASTTVVSNLNADMLDGLHSSSFVDISNPQTIGGTKTFSNSITAPSFLESSLRSLKTNIKPLEQSGLELINELDIVTFDRKDKTAKDKIGIIADDSPKEFLSENLDAVDLYKTVFIQAKAIQELKSEVDELKELVKQLLNKK